MARAFNDVTLKWKGSEYTIPSDQMLEAINRIEDHVSLETLHVRAGEKPSWKRGKIAQAYAAVLNFAGAKVTPEEVYAGMFEKGETNAAGVAVQALIFLMVPNSLLEEGDGEPKK